MIVGKSAASVLPVSRVLVFKKHRNSWDLSFVGTGFAGKLDSWHLGPRASIINLDDTG